MTQDQLLIVLILLATMVMFIWGRWRHDMVAGGALLACVLTGLIDAEAAFLGFAHPAVVTVACVLVLSRGLQISGAVDVLTRHVLPKQAGPVLSIAALTGLGAFLSGFMNNVGAMALLMPVAMQLSGRLNLTPGQVLMPLAFGTILGGMTTLIGTPPNLIVSGFRNESIGSGFEMFDFAFVGMAVALLCVLFIALPGWRLVPARKQPGAEGFDTGAYFTEVRVLEGSKVAGMHIREADAALGETEAQITGMIRNNVRINAPLSGRYIKAGDILIIEADVEALTGVIGALGLALEEAESPDDDADKETGKGDDESASKSAKPQGKDEEPAEAEAPIEEPGSNGEGVILMELVVRTESALQGRSASDMKLRTRYGLNLLALSREGSRSRARLRTMKIKAGDLLLMQGSEEALSEFAADHGCIPLAERELHLPERGKALAATLIMLASVAAAAFALLPTAIAFAAGVLASMAVRTVPLRSVYDAIDWPVIILLGALMPVASVMESTGTATLVAELLMEHVAQGSTLVALGLILTLTMLISSVVNNAATAAAMCPIALGTAATLGVQADAFLMAVAIGASCAFLTPVGHQNNTLILGPGGFRFGDYWRLGLPVSILVVVISIPLLWVVWPP
ncbi:SLC13 family permease [Marinobacterium sediminicola]|uniref:TrkA-C domain-containing protein n=1 Tax=Marinobacterium sediminicola TaxID=518898 RepID=A0ABY1S4A3_9GAMM|nr:SLC13 family permease [Marinobacterium sediminicola]ULG68961.1 SLC13 family permease [Marinobacterium sediminicola]SMR78463.1 TrkA-C domain-containing protein [Marinobacterium sediminicola]